MPRFAAPPYMGTIFINDKQDLDGWSEIYWIDAANIKEAYDTLIEVGTARCGMLTPDYSVVYARTSDTSVRGDSYSKPLPTGTSAMRGFFNAGISLVKPVDLTQFQIGSPNNLAVKLRIRTLAARINANRMLRGVPRSLLSKTEDSRAFLPDQQWINAFDNWKTVLVNNCQIVHVVDHGTGDNATELAAGITATAVKMTVTGQDGFPDITPFVVLIGTEKIKVLKYLPNNEWSIRRAWDGTVAAIHAADDVVYSVPLDTVQVSPIAEIVYADRLAYHKTGRPFGLLRGRRAPKPTSTT